MTWPEPTRYGSHSSAVFAFVAWAVNPFVAFVVVLRSADLSGVTKVARMNLPNGITPMEMWMEPLG